MRWRHRYSEVGVSLTDKPSGSQAEIYKAWNVFIDKGILLDGIVRPVIARSWKRSQGIDPRARNWHRLPERILQAKRAENIKLLSIARPIMEELCEITGRNSVLLCDREAHILETAGNLQYSPPPGLRFSEEDVGTNAIGTVLVEEAPVEVRGTEHYLSSLHSSFSAGAPIRGVDGNIIGIIAVSNAFEELPAGVLQTLKLGVRVIENHLKYKAEQSKVLWTYHRTCSSIIDLYQEPLMVVDANCTVANVNERCLELMGINDRKELVGELIDNLIVDGPQVIASLLSTSPSDFRNRFGLKGAEKVVPCSVIRRRIVRNPDGSHQVILVFKGENEINEGHARIRVIATTYESGESSVDNLIVGESQAMNDIRNLIKKAACVSSNVLIEGESGTGKELVAQAIHKESGRKGPFIAINCGAIPKELLQSELFGYEEGAFTGARKGGNPGKFELGDGGTVFLDEIGEMPFDMQVNLLRFLQDKAVIRVGGSEPRNVDVRIVAATNRNLKQEIALGNFREDLYYRLSVINIQIPPLRERRLDIPLTARFLIGEICRQFKRETLRISDAAMELLFHYSWPGNVRELRNVLENAVVFTEGNLITEDVLPSYLKGGNNAPLALASDAGSVRVAKTDVPRELTIDDAREFKKKLAADKERFEILRLLDKFEGNVSQVARHMGLSRNTIYRKMRMYKVDTREMP